MSVIRYYNSGIFVEADVPLSTFPETGGSGAPIEGQNGWVPVFTDIFGQPAVNGNPPDNTSVTFSGIQFPYGDSPVQYLDSTGLFSSPLAAGYSAGGDLTGTYPNPVVKALSGTPMTLDGTVERFFRSPLPHASGTVTPGNGTAYFLYLGITANAMTPQFVEFFPETVGAGLTSLEVGLFSTPDAPGNEVAQTLTKLVSGTVTAPTIPNIPAHNTTAFSTSIPAGTPLWAGILISRSGGSMPTMNALTGDWNNGNVETLSSSGAFSSTSTFAAGIPSDRGSSFFPELRVAMDAVVDPVIPFDPRQISGLTLWLDPTSLIGLSDGDPITSILDKSPNGFTFSTTAGTITYKTNQVNGLPIMRFASANLDSPSELVSSWFDDGYATIIFICKQTGGAAIMNFRGSIGSGAELFYYCNYGGSFSVYYTVNNYGVYVPGNWEDGNFHSVLYDNSCPGGDSKRFFSDGTLLGSTSTAVGALDGSLSYPLEIGSDGYGTWFGGDIACVLCYNKRLSSTEQATLSAWATATYGIAGI